MKRIFLLFFSLAWLFALTSAQTQDEPATASAIPRHAMLAEANWFILGSSYMFHSVGYEYEYWRSKRGTMQMGLRIGAGFSQDLPGGWISEFSLPVANRFSFGASAHRFEAALGAQISTAWYFPIWPILQLGYRHQPLHRGMIWRVHLGTLGLGASIGWSF